MEIKQELLKIELLTRSAITDIENNNIEMSLDRLSEVVNSLEKIQKEIDNNKLSKEATNRLFHPTKEQLEKRDKFLDSIEDFTLIHNEDGSTTTIGYIDCDLKG